jgi:two-component system alkaline phosphatase synthesis response regulator PhoP
MRHPNQTLSRLQILDELYPTDQKLVSERTVDVHILKLREKFKAHIGDDEIIETVRGIGYRFIAF